MKLADIGAAIGAVSTTPLRIIVSIALAAFCVFIVMAGLVFRIPWSDGDIRVLELVGILLLTMMGFDVLQFVSKRTTDNSYVTAKGDAKAKVASATGPNVNAGPEGSVNITQQQPDKQPDKDQSNG